MKKKRYLFSFLLFILFIVLIILIKSGGIIALDNAVYNIIHKMYGDLATSIFKVITFFGSTLFIVMLSILLFIVWKKNRGGLIFAILIIISTLVNNIIKIIIRRPRPEVLRLVEEHTFSFPSGHTMAVSTLVFFLIYYVWKKKGRWDKNKKIIISALLIIYDLLVMISRIYLGAHFVSDVIGALICSLIIIILLAPLLDRYLAKK